MRRIFFLFCLCFFLAACKSPNTSEAKLLVSNTTLALTGVAPSETLLIRNIGAKDSILEWSIEPSSPAVLLSMRKGSMAFGEQRSVAISIDERFVQPGKALLETLTVNSNGGQKTVYLSFVLLGEGLGACGTYPTSSNELPQLSQPRPSTAYVPGELLVQYASELNVQSVALQKEALKTLALEVNPDYGLSLQKNPSPYRPALVNIPGDKDPLEVAKELMRDPRVKFAEPNYYLQLLDVPSDPSLSEQWHLTEFGVSEAWALEKGTGDVVVAVIDSGVDMSHEDLEGKILPGCDFYDNKQTSKDERDNDPNPGVPNGGRSEHGTHVAGIIAALGGNDKGGVGVAYGAGVKIIPLKVFDDTGVSGSIDALVDAMLWAAGIELEGVAINPNPADIVNMSVGADAATIADDLLSIHEATKALHDKGILMFAASGNNGSATAVLSPANSPYVAAVGSVDTDYKRSSFSNYAQQGPTVSFVAPGGAGAIGCAADGIRSTFSEDSYGCLKGTSMSSPFVAGVAALLLSQNPDLTKEQVLDRLEASALYDPVYMSTAEYGRGIICADRALGASTQCGR